MVITVTYVKRVSSQKVLGPDNEAVTSGSHYKEFEDRIGKSHYYGARTKVGEVWKARGQNG